MRKTNYMAEKQEHLFNMEQLLNQHNFSQFESQSGELFFLEATLSTKSSVTIKIFDQTGNLRILKTIEFPSKLLSVFLVSRYIVGLDQGEKNIYTVDATDSYPNFLNCSFYEDHYRANSQQINKMSNQSQKGNHQKLNEQEKTKFTSFYYDKNTNLIFGISNHKQIYTLERDIMSKSLKVDHLLSIYESIDKLEVNQDGDIFLQLRNEKAIRQISVDYNKLKVLKNEKIEGVVDFCVRSGWNVMIKVPNAQEKNLKKKKAARQSSIKKVQHAEHEEFILTSSSQGTYECPIKLSLRQVMYCTKNDFVLIDTSAKVFFSIFQREMSLIEGVSYSLKRLTTQNSLISLSKQLGSYLKLNILKFDAERYSFVQSEHKLSTKQYKDPISSAQNWLRLNIERVFCFSGLISPVCIKRVKVWVSESDRESSQDDIQCTWTFLKKFVLKDSELTERLFKSVTRQFLKMISQLQTPLKYTTHTKQTSLLDSLMQGIVRWQGYLWDITSEYRSILSNQFSRLELKRSESQQNSSSPETSEQDSAYDQNSLNCLYQCFDHFISSVESCLDRCQFYSNTHMKTENSRTFLAVKSTLNSLQSIKTLLLMLKNLSNRKDLTQIVGQIFMKFHKLRKETLQKKQQNSTYPQKIYPLFIFEHFERAKALGLITSLDYDKIQERDLFIEIFKIFKSYLMSNLENFEEISYFCYEIENIASEKFKFESVDERFRLIEKIPILPSTEDREDASILNYLKNFVLVALKSKHFPLLKYACQLCLYYRQPSLVTLILNWDTFKGYKVSLFEKNLQLQRGVQLLINDKSEQHGSQIGRQKNEQELLSRNVEPENQEQLQLLHQHCHFLFEAFLEIKQYHSVIALVKQLKDKSCLSFSYVEMVSQRLIEQNKFKVLVAIKHQILESSNGKDAEQDWNAYIEAIDKKLQENFDPEQTSEFKEFEKLMNQ